ncbi:hypothetical protein GMDG_04139 [Pseudogymnoascus destructans 20631-21]|uniref:Lanosterol 14-alpha-demethylase n=1 Tax=Pseudogymnoascus destructans (strain ATCC MYA-4855 / 20631-21) TaxID=658429 RepID=L8GAI8_PSED2|nr:hypothetical protein GMDG_04139 [Pseudogymnoascus destructans 20631-21]
MGLTESLTEAVLIPINAQISERGLGVVAAVGFASFIVLAVVLNVLSQLLPQNPNEPPLVFHWFPILGNTISYGMDPYPFFFKCREKYGDIFTFILLGKKTTVYLGTAGNEFILNGKLKDVNAEEIYTKLTTPVFGTGVVYDCPNSKLMEQKKFVKVSLTTETFRSYVPLIVQEVTNFIKTSPMFKGPSGKTDVPAAMSEITIYTASRTLQGKEVRSRFNAEFANLFHDLDMGFTPINFMLHWAPLPQNRARDRAQRILSETYMEIIQERRAGNVPDENEHDLIRHLMASVYKDGTPLPDKEISHMMIAMLMAGQHSSSSTSSWMMLNLAARPDIIEGLYQEQIRLLGADLPPLTYENLGKLTLNNAVLKETLRLHTPIHSILRKVKSPHARPRNQLRHPNNPHPPLLRRCHRADGGVLPRPSQVGPPSLGRRRSRRPDGRDQGGARGLRLRHDQQGRHVALPALWRWPPPLHRRAVRRPAARGHHRDHGARVQVEAA